MARQYYYLIASLPNLIFEHEAKGFDFLQLKDFIRENINHSDYRLVELLCTPVDIQNIVNLKFSENYPFIEGGKFNEEELKEELAEPQYIPQYVIDMLDKLSKMRADKENTDTSDDEFITNPEKLLLEKFYIHIEKSDNSFIRQWFAFDRDIRNIQAAYVARKFNFTIEDQLIGAGDINELLTKNMSADFGLRRERDYIDKLWQIFEITDILEREKKLDLLKWSYIDDFTTFNYFDMSVVLAFVQKAYVVNRWMKLDEETGIAMFEQLVSDLKQTYNSEEAFKNVN